jgi:hypothetical protein
VIDAKGAITVQFLEGFAFMIFITDALCHFQKTIPIISCLYVITQKCCGTKQKVAVSAQIPQIGPQHEYKNRLAEQFIARDRTTACKVGLPNVETGNKSLAQMGEPNKSLLPINMIN